jgi:hypothetical protein
MSFAYFIEQGDMVSTLRLNNNLPQVTEATVTVFNSQGQSFSAPVSLPPQDVQRFSVAELTANAPGDFHSGNIQVAYYGPPMAVTGQVSIASTNGHIIFESFPTMAMAFASSRLDGIAWVPDAGTRASAALTANVVAGVTIKPVTLGAHETRVVDLTDSLDKRPGAAVLMHIDHSGTPGAVIVNAFAINERTGFSCNLPFIDRATAKTTRLAGAHVRLGKPDRAEGFPAATRFNAPLVVANAGDLPTEARVFVDYTVGGVASRAEVGRLKLAPQQVQQVELSNALARLGVNRPLDDAGLDVDYTGSPGTLIARLTSLDQSGDFAFDVPVKDPLAEMNRVGGNYPWRLDDGFSTVLHLKNTIDQKVFALVQVRYAGGSYNLERLPLQPFQTVAVDLRALRDSQQPDIRDSLFPKEVEGGEVVWFEETVGSLIGRAEMASPKAAVASSFSCGEQCQCPPTSYTAYLTPSSSVGPVGGTAQFQSMERRQDCHGVLYGPYDRTSTSTWHSDNTTVFTVSAGTVSCLQPGSGNVTAQFSATIYTLNCFQQTTNPTVGGPVQVYMPQLVGVISPLVSGDADSAISGQAFTLQIEARVPNSNQVVASFNRPVTVTFPTPDLISGESISQNPVSMTQGVGRATVVLKVIDNTPSISCCRTYTLSVTTGATPGTGAVKVWFPVTMDIERWKNCNFSSCPNLGSYVCTTACGGGLSVPTEFIALTSNACNSAVIVRNTANGASQSTTVHDVGPTTGNAYWHTGSIPSIGGCVSDKLADTLGVSYGCNPNVGQASVLWRFQ